MAPDHFRPAQLVGARAMLDAGLSVSVAPAAGLDLRASTLPRIAGHALPVMPLRHRLFSQVELVAGPALAPAQLAAPLTAELTTERLQAEVQALLTR